MDIEQDYTDFLIIHNFTYQFKNLNKNLDIFINNN